MLQERPRSLLFFGSFFDSNGIRLFSILVAACVGLPWPLAQSGAAAPQM